MLRNQTRTTKSTSKSTSKSNANSEIKHMLRNQTRRNAFLAHVPDMGQRAANIPDAYHPMHTRRHA
eukprot:1268099-Rhodomonas_salina.1